MNTTFKNLDEAAAVMAPLYAAGKVAIWTTYRVKDGLKVRARVGTRWYELNALPILGS